VRARERARRLVRRIEAAIEAGEFTPFHTFLWDHERLGPCGCAVAAGQFVSGVKPPGPSVLVLPFGVRPFGDVSKDEAAALQGGYEDYDGFDGPFFAAGRELRKFHPGVPS
jgi:hypothetical protein